MFFKKIPNFSEVLENLVLFVELGIIKYTKFKLSSEEPSNKYLKKFHIYGCDVSENNSRFWSIKIIIIF